MEFEKKILVIVPAYNEDGTIGQVIAETEQCFPLADIVVVNDGSTDSTGPIAAKEGVILLEHPYNMGIGATMQTGFLYASRNDYDIAVQVDGDGQHDPKYLNDLIYPILKGESNMVIGSRYLEEKGFKSTISRRTGIRFFCILYHFLTGGRVTDPTSGFRALNKKVIDFFSEEYPADYPEAESLILFHRRGFILKEIPVVMKERQGGVSSIDFLRSIYYMIKVTLAIVIGTLKKI
jgi:glycosyltransferase involved in cell wall biosynthesis